MTIAICFKCGEFKHGSFKPCPSCGSIPHNTDDLSLSMALTDHYFDNSMLEELRKNIKQGINIELPDEVRTNFQKLIKESGVLEIMQLVQNELSHQETDSNETTPQRVSVDIDYLKSAATAFEVAHDFVGLRALITEEAGTFQSFIKNLFRTVDYQHFANRAKEIKDKIEKLSSDIKLLSPPNTLYAQEFADALHQYVNALSKASEILLNKSKLMAAKAREPKTPEISYSEFKKIIKNESSSLEECQITGDKLTILYRKNIGMC